MELLSLGGACSLAKQLFLSSPFLTRKDPCTGIKSKSYLYQSGRVPLLPAHWLMPMVEMMWFRSVSVLLTSHLVNFNRGL